MPPFGKRLDTVTYLSSLATGIIATVSWRSASSLLQPIPSVRAHPNAYGGASHCSPRVSRTFQNFFRFGRSRPTRFQLLFRRSASNSYKDSITSTAMRTCGKHMCASQKARAIRTSFLRPCPTCRLVRRPIAAKPAFLEARYNTRFLTYPILFLWRPYRGPRIHFCSTSLCGLCSADLLYHTKKMALHTLKAMQYICVPILKRGKEKVLD